MPTLGLNDPDGGAVKQSRPKKPQPGQSMAPTDPSNQLYNPGITEQAFDRVQNDFLNDPYAAQAAAQGAALGQQTTGQQWSDQHQNDLNGPGTGQQHWSQVAGQYMDPFAGEQYGRQAVSDFEAQGPSSAFYDQAMGDSYAQQTGFNTGNAQGQYNTSAGQLAGGTQGEAGLGQIAGQYDEIGQYGGPNYAAGQYAQTQGAFGDMPIANFDPFYDRASQLATQNYNRQSAGRGVYGSSEALSGVGNIITDIEAQRANRSFDAEMQRAQEQRMRQQLLGEQARNSDLSGTEAFTANLQGAETFGNINNDLATQEINRNELLGNMANQADTQAVNANNSRTDAISAFGDIAHNADTDETARLTASTNAASQADKDQLARMDAGVDNAFQAQDAAREDFTAQSNAATASTNAATMRSQAAAQVMNNLSQNRQQGLRDFMNAASGAEAARMTRQLEMLNQSAQLSGMMSNAVSQGLEQALSGDQAMLENWFTTQLAPELQRAGVSQADQDAFLDNLTQISEIYANVKAGSKK